MKRVLLFCGLIVAVASCNDNDGRNYFGGGGPGQYADPCQRNLTCGTCTPARGCGWCEYGQGKGVCLSDPDECPSQQQFTWTWVPELCSATTGDGGAYASDGASSDGAASDAHASDGPAPVTDAGVHDAAISDAGDASPAACTIPPAANTFQQADASATGCQPSTGGNLCFASQYTLSCHGNTGAISTPDPALKCTVVAVPTPSNELFYCCPCGS